jgi:hypothetical protein
LKPFSRSRISLRGRWCSIKDQLNRLLLVRIPLLQLFPCEQLNKGHHCLPHIHDVALLLVNVRCVDNYPLQAVQFQRPFCRQLATSDVSTNRRDLTVLNEIRQTLRRSNRNTCPALLKKGDLFFNFEVLGKLNLGQHGIHRSTPMVPCLPVSQRYSPSSETFSTIEQGLLLASQRPPRREYVGSRSAWAPPQASSGPQKRSLETLAGFLKIAASPKKWCP